MSRPVLMLALACVAFACFWANAVPAIGAPGDPLFVIAPKKAKTKEEEEKNGPPMEAPCGLAVATNGNVSISDYYHHEIHVLEPKVTEPKFVGGFGSGDPLVGPCGLAFDFAGHLWVNNFHRNVEDLTGNVVLPLPAEETAKHLPAGVAYDPLTEYVYVNNRTYITAYEQDGTQVMEGLTPLRIGVGSLGDGYGLAVSAFPGTAGRIYVPDAASKTVKTYDPSVSKVNPVATIGGPGKGFNSLRDSTVAVDRVTGVVYVIDNLQPVYTEEPEAAVDVFNSAGAFLGVLKYKVFDALPPGLAVDNTASLVTQGRVYVTSGNTDNAGLYAYAPGSQTNGFLPPTVGMVVKTNGTGGGLVSNSLLHGTDCAGSCSLQPLAGSSVTLTAVPDQGSQFEGWSGACSGAEQSCTVKMDQSALVSATFASTEAPTSPAGAQPQGSDVLPSSSPGTLAARPHRTRRHRHRRHHGRRKAAGHHRADSHR